MHFELEFDKFWVKLQAQALDQKLVKLKPKPKSSQKPYTVWWRVCPGNVNKRNYFEKKKVLVCFENWRS
jgi:hypothetical protein